MALNSPESSKVGEVLAASMKPSKSPEQLVQENAAKKAKEAEIARQEEAEKQQVASMAENMEAELAAATATSEKPAVLVSHNEGRRPRALSPQFFVKAEKTLADCHSDAVARWGVCPGMPA